MEKQHKTYQEELNKVVKSQENIKKPSFATNILKQEEIKKLKSWQKQMLKLKKEKIESLMNSKKLQQ